MRSAARFVAILAVTFFAANTRAQDTKPAEATSKPAEVKFDLSTPKGAMKTFMTALMRGDADSAKKAVIAEAAETKFIDEMAAATASFKKLADAAKVKYGDEGKTIAPFASDDARMDMLDSAQEAVTGDTATVSTPNNEKIPLKKVGDDWKIEMSKMPNIAQMKQALPMFQTMKKMSDEFAAEISGGKYPTVADAKKAMETKMVEAITAQAVQATTTTAPAPAATQPVAPAPTAQP